MGHLQRWHTWGSRWGEQQRQDRSNCMKQCHPGCPHAPYWDRTAHPGPWHCTKQRHPKMRVPEAP
jgi:hypothetical protein